MVESEAKETGRVEAFSDGVFAIAITLLGFTFKVPSTAGAHLATALAASWPALVAFVTSFMTIGILYRALAINRRPHSIRSPRRAM